MEQQLQQHEEPALDPKLVEKLSSKKAEERAKAEQAIEQLGPEAVDALLGLLREEARKKKRKTRLYLVGLSVWIGLLLVMMLTGNSEHIASFSGMFSMFAAMAAATQAQKNAASRLTAYDDIRAVGPLTEAMEYQDKALNAQIEPKLTDLLPRLRASDGALLSEEQRKILYRLLSKRRSPLLAIAILQAFEQVGDSHALPFVQRVANGEGATANSPRVQAAAKACLPALEQRAANERAAQTLLRAACAPDDPAAILLRPAESVPETDSARLLRPVDESPAPD